jgi:hypothetical protein
MVASVREDRSEVSQFQIGGQKMDCASRCESDFAWWAYITTASRPDKFLGSLPWSPKSLPPQKPLM